MVERTKQFADLRAQVKCLTCAHPHHVQRKINSIPVRCGKTSTNDGQSYVCPCSECTCQFCVLEELKRLKSRHTTIVKTLEDIEDGILDLINKYPGELRLKSLRDLMRTIIAGEGKR